MLSDVPFKQGVDMASKLKLASVIVGVALLSNANAAAVLFSGAGSGPGGVPVGASALFDITGNTLTITLSNTSPGNNGQDVPGSTLSGLFFDLTGNPVLTPQAAMVAAGSSIIGGVCDNVSCVGVTNVAGEFGYQAGPLPGGADRGISSSGYLTTGLPGNIGNFNGGNAGTDLDSPESLNGINFGIVSSAAGYNPNGGLADEPVIRDSVVFTLTGVAGLTIDDITKVSFQYGTDLSELNVPGTPGRIPPLAVTEPGSMALAGLALVSLAAWLRRRPARPRLLTH